ncbi:MAG: thiamine pyrophosphate-dependent enzyme, partial [Burkholderiales bacterium]|nr:thiamine pyrophosphate-dependent enzyme [Burkholderiales bacterium]
LPDALPICRVQADPDLRAVVRTPEEEGGAVAAVAAQRPPNLSIVVLDNAHYGETGMQRSHTGLGTRLAEVARACGIEDACEVRTLEGADAVARRVAARAGPSFAQVHVHSDALPRALPPRDGAFLKNRFRAAIGLAPL